MSPGVVAQRVSYVTHFSIRGIKGVRVAHICRTSAGCNRHHRLMTTESRWAERGWPGAGKGHEGEGFSHAHPPHVPSRGPCHGRWAFPQASDTFVRRRRVRRPRCSSRRPATPPVHPALDEARVSGAGPWCAAPHGAPGSDGITGAQRACVLPPYRPRCSVVSWPGWYGPRVPARPADSPRPGRLCAQPA